MEQKKLLFAGSHAGSTAIAVIEEIKRRKLNWEIHWVGMEYKNLQNLGIIFHSLESGKVENKFTKHTVSSFLKIPVGLVNSYRLVKEIKPDLTFSFGSSAGATTSLWSNILKIPVIIHEQTAVAGRANIFSSYFAKLILTSRETSSTYFNKKKVKLVGNPLNKEILSKINYGNRARVKTILVTGGSRGSTWINDAIRPILPRLLEKYYVIHQTGEKSLEEFKTLSTIIKGASGKYFVFSQTDPKNMADVFAKSDIVIGRAGANTVWELVALKKPSILVPIPWSYNDEQNENAKYMESQGLARILPQKELTPQKLLSEIEILISDYPKIIAKTEDIISPDLEASEKIVDILEENM